MVTMLKVGVWVGGGVGGWEGGCQHSLWCGLCVSLVLLHTPLVSQHLPAALPGWGTCVQSSQDRVGDAGRTNASLKSRLPKETHLLAAGTKVTLSCTVPQSRIRYVT